MRAPGYALALMMAATVARAAPAAAPAAVPTGDGGAAAEIARLVAAADHPTMRRGRFPDAKADVGRFYAARGNAPAWVAAGRATPAAGTLITRFASAAELGLDPADYDAERLSRTARAYAEGRAPDPREAARFDVAMTVDAWRLVRALRFGRVSPARAHHTLALARPDEDVAARVDSLTHEAWIGPVLAGIQPPFRHYRLLVEALGRYRSLARDSTLLPLPSLPRKLAPGEPWAGAPRLRRLLSALGDFGDSVQAGPPPVAADTLYDAALAQAVAAFQRRNGLAADGVIGSQTAARLNRPFGERIHQIELTLERWRWLPRDYSAPPIFVNIPLFRLHAFRTLDDDETTMLSMDVVVGIAYQHDTPIFTAPLSYIVFRPYWEVPTSIAKSEMRPKALRDAAYLARERLVLVRGGAEVPPTAANIQAMGGAVRVRQKPGPSNALGNVKFMLPNPYNVYLHDTPSKGRFEAVRRDFSHGCIRLSQPAALAEFLLRDQPEWTRERIAAAMEAENPSQVYLKRPVPVYVLYGTAVARQDGTTAFFADLYGHDATLDALLRGGYPYPP